MLVVNDPFMGPWNNQASDETVRVEILVAAYLAGDRSLFWQASRYILLHYNQNEIKNRHNGILEDNLPEAVTSKSSRGTVHINEESTDHGEGE